MLQKTLLVILFSFLFVACGKLPPRPSVYVCTYFDPTKQFYCVNSEDQNDTKTLTSAQGNKSVCVSPDAWSTIQDYIKDLKKLANQHCSKF